MQLLMSEAAYGRVEAELPDDDGLEVVIMSLDGSLSLPGRSTGEIEPEVFWLSLDMYASGLLPKAFQQILKGSRSRWAQVFVAGLDNPAFKMVMAKGVRLTKSDAQAPAIAEYVVAHAFDLLHPIAAQRAAQDAREWRRIPFREIGSTRWLLIGFGAIGSAIAERVKPFGAHVTAITRRGAPDQRVDEVRPSSGLLALLPQADVVVLACPLTDETRNLANQSFFQALKPGAVLINIGRGGLLDEDALRSSIDREQPATAVLDVFQTEPLAPDSWLWSHPKVRVTAHCSNAGDGVLRRGDVQFLDNLGRFRNGQPLLNEAAPAEVGL